MNRLTNMKKIDLQDSCEIEMGTSTRLPTIDKHSNNGGESLDRKSRQFGNTVYGEKNIKSKGRASYLTLDSITPAHELPLGLAVSLARDVIRIERHYREQKLLDEIRRNRASYHSLKRKIIDENRGKYQGFSKLKHDNISRFSYFPPIDQARQPATGFKADSYYAPKTNKDSFVVNKTITIEKMRKFGQKHKTLTSKKENSRSDLNAQQNLFYP